MRRTRRRSTGALAALLLALAACSAPRSAPAPAAEPDSCEAWAERSTRALAATPEPERYQRALEAIAESCDALPSSLRGGAKTAARRPSRQERNDILDAATRRLLPQACHPWSPTSPALDVVARCPLDPKLSLARGALQTMSGAEYNFLKALQVSFREANEYSAPVEALLREFASAAARQGKP